MKGFSLTKRNVVGNLLGKAYAACMSFAFVPIYINLLGPDAYGLIGTYVSLQVIVALLDMGLSPLLTRELARLSDTAGNAQEARDLVRTLEVIYWLIGLGIGATVIALAPWIAHHALQSHVLPVSTVTQVIAITGVILIFQWPDSFYSGGLMGLQRQTTLNLIRVCFTTVQGIGGIILLRFVSTTVQAYFWWLVLLVALAAWLIWGIGRRPKG